MQRTEYAWTLRLLEVLDDGEWHDYEDVVKQVATVVPEQLAYDKAEYYREYHYRKKGKEPATRRYGDRDDSIKTGRRFIVSRSVQSLLRRELITLQYHDDTRARRRPSRIRSIK